MRLIAFAAAFFLTILPMAALSDDKPLVSRSEAENILRFFADRDAVADYQYGHSGRVAIGVDPRPLVENVELEDMEQFAIYAAAGCGLALSSNPAADGASTVLTLFKQRWTQADVVDFLRYLQVADANALAPILLRSIQLTNSATVTQKGPMHTFAVYFLSQADTSSVAYSVDSRVIFQSLRGAFGLTDAKYSSITPGLFAYFAGYTTPPPEPLDEKLLVRNICRAMSLIEAACSAKQPWTLAPGQVELFQQYLQGISDMCEAPTR